MPYRRTPNSMPSVIRVLKTAKTMWDLSDPAERAITADQAAMLDTSVPTSLLSRLLKEVGEVDLAQAAQAPLTDGLSIAAARLTMYCSHFHQVLDFGIARGVFAKGARKYYDRDITATALPDLSSYDDIIEAADKIVAGEIQRATAEAAGVPHYDDGTTYDGGATYDASGATLMPHVPMSNPSATDVGAVRDRFVTLRGKVKQAEVKTNREQEEAMALYPEAQLLAVDICDTVEFYFRKDPDASSRRAKCEQWGVVYIYDTPAPAPQPPATPTNPTQPNP